MNESVAGRPSVSVVIPAYRAAATIGRAVQSVLAQTVPAAEILVIDDGSPDDLVGALAEFGERVTLVRKPNGGAASARNLGIERATGDLIGFLDADDYWEPMKLQRQLRIFRQHPEVGLVAGQYFAEPPGAHRAMALVREAAWFDGVLRLNGEPAFRAATIIWTGTVIVRRETLEGERFVSGLEPAEDRDLWVRLVLKAPCYLSSEALATAVLEPGSLSRSNVDRDCGNMLRVIHRHRSSLGRSEVRKWESDTFRRWAAGHLGAKQPKAAVLPACRRLVREPWNLQAWWIVFKSVVWGLSRSRFKRIRWTASGAIAVSILAWWLVRDAAPAMRNGASNEGVHARVCRA